MAVKVLPPVAGGDPARSWYKTRYPPGAGGRGREVRWALVACVLNPKFAESLIIPAGKGRFFVAISGTVLFRVLFSLVLALFLLFWCFLR